MDGLYNAIYRNFIRDDRYMYMLNGLETTVIIALAAAALGMIIGVVMALGKISKNKIFNVLASTYVEIIRGTPTVVQLMIIYYIIFGSTAVPKLMIAIVAFGINSGGYVAEIVRAGIQAVDKGQMEAARSLGMTYGMAMRHVIMPQAFRNILPALVNEFITLLKETSVSGFIALDDLTKGADIIRGITFDPYTPLLTAAAIYLVLTNLISFIFRKVERRMRISEQ
ncbi:amino acid ABC transporter permease [Mahella australiensis]|uniref:Amino acid ABC transporter membrane protein, PAAT family n=1 Tax=Mahella australiensis (strain DSM 15567 / CIP 107919 / 50-1 BON) TaxID=697281 RepID=F3ZZ76_MAHA5|nr:amino acid ABC transporter permease [Mahella australiensis]AEE97858.1 amino acid ABC transporter membrane protein, PAAT family [Mahella australiensis 50-1 BON]